MDDVTGRAGATSGECWTPGRLLEALASRGDRPALLVVTGDRVEEWSGARLAEEARRLATGLRREGLAPQEPAAIYGPNTPDWVIVRLALGAAGALPVPIDDATAPGDAQALLHRMGCRWLFTTAQHAAALPAMAEGERPRIALLDGWEEPSGWRALRAQQAEPLPTISPEAPAMVVTTSGTTGAPKLFRLSHANLHANLAAVLQERLIGPEDRILLPLPLHHVYPFLIGLMTPLAAGSAVVFPEAVTGPQILQALRLGRVTAIVGVPRLYIALLAGLEGRIAAGGRAAKAAFSGLLALSGALSKRGIPAGRRLFRPLHAKVAPDLRLMISGAAKLEGEAAQRMEALGWQVLSGYGLAETASMFTGNLPGRKRFGSEGRPIAAGSELRIARPDAQGEGEIQLRGPNVFAGYLDDPEANAGAFTADGWFRSGDLGRVDADGFLHVTGRVKEIIVLGGGKKIVPEELEKTYGASRWIEEVALLERDGALVAIVRPDLAAIRASANARVEDVLRVALAEAAQALPPWQRLSGFVIARDPLPRTRLGKFHRHLLPAIWTDLRDGSGRARPSAPLAAEDAALVARPGAREVWAILQARYGHRELSPEASPLLDLGIDSLEWVTLSLEIEQRTGLRLDEQEMAGFETVRALLERAARDAAEPRAAPAPERGDEAVRRWTTPAPAALAPLRAAAWWLDRRVARLLFDLRAEGTEHLPESGPFVVVANHVSDLDPGLVAAALPLDRARRVWWGGTVDRLFSGAVGRGFGRLFQIFPVDERAPAATVAMARAVLARGDALVWFPESWRSPDGSLQRFLPGIGLILQGLDDVPVLPALIEGAFEAMPRNRRLPRPHPVRITFGPPLRVRDLAGSGEAADQPLRIAAALHEAVARLGGQRGA